MILKKLFPILFLSLTFCGGIDELTPKPPEEEKNLSQEEIAEAREVFGAIGDMQYLIKDLGRSNPIDVNRELHRKQLKDSLDLRRCQVADKGTLSQGEFNLKLDGPRCSVRMNYRQKRRLLTKTASAKVELLQVENEFSTQVIGVRTELNRFSMDGEYRNIYEKNENTNRWRQELDVQLTGVSKKLGQFTYTLEENWLTTQEDHKPGESQKERVSIGQRVDRISNEGTRVTLVRIERLVDGSLTGVEYRLNAGVVPEADYLEIIQDLHNQWSVEALESR